MGIKILVLVAICLIPLFTVPVFAQVIDFTTDEEIYYQFQTITFSGVVDVDPDIPDIFIEYFNPEKKFTGSFTREINPDGTFIFKLQANPDVYTIDGEYTFKITYVNSVEKTINYQKFRDIAPFVDQSKNPCSYVDRYNNEQAYEEWFRDNYPEYIGIYEAVGIHDKREMCEPKMSEAEKQVREEIPNPCNNIKEPKVATEYQGDIGLNNPAYIEAVREAQYQYQQQIQHCYREYQIQIDEKIKQLEMELVPSEIKEAFGQEVGFYENELHEFSFSIPSDWTEIKDIQMLEGFEKYVVLYAPVNMEDFPSIGVQYEFVSSSSVPTLNERTAENYVSEQIIPTLPIGRMTSSSVESKSWGWVVSTEFFDAEYFFEMKSYFFENGDLYHVEYASIERHFDTYHPVFETVLDSLEIKGTKVTKLEIIPISSPSNGGGCLIATATYGSELAPQVQMLREIRDNSLLQTQSGQSFMQGFNSFYYSFSPAIADYERQNPAFKEVVKVIITPLLASLSLLNYVDLDSEESVLGYGIGIILMNVGMYFVAPVIVISKIIKYKI